MPCPIDSEIMFSMEKINRMTSLPWTPFYAQSQGEQEPSIMSTYAMALTVLFTVFVFAFEHMLDERQAAAYKITKFPEQLEQTVRLIDAEKKNKKPESTTGDGDRKDSTATATATAADEKKDLDKDKPILPQLKDKFAKAQTYGTDKISFGMLCSLYNLLESVLFLMCGFLPYVWDYSVKLGDQYGGYNENDNEIKITLIFMLVTTVIGTITSLPFELYSTFRIEKKHGFNKQTPALFFTDKIKSLLLTCVIGGPFVSILLKIIKWGGESFYIYVWGFMFLFSTIMMTLVPVFIMPLFNKYEPLEDSELKTRIYALADRLKYPLTKLFMMDGSKRSSHSNAFMFGFGKNKRIVLYDTLMNQVDDDEILAILGHELGHWKLGHTLSSFAVTQAYFGASFYCFSLCYGAGSTDLYRAFGFDGVDRPIPTMLALLLFFQTIWAPIDKVLSFILTINSRRNEFAADRFSSDLGMSAKLQTGLCKISLENLGAMCPDPWYAIYHYSHPPLVERLSAMTNSEKKTN